MATEKKPLSPRETAIRMLEHVQDDVSYEDIIHQLRILQQIEWVMKDIEMAGLPPENTAPKGPPRIPEDASSISFTSEKPSLVLRSDPLLDWRSLAERSDDSSDPFFRKASWID